MFRQRPNDPNADTAFVDEDEEGGDAAAYFDRMITPEDLVERDLPDGPELRFKVFEVVWKRCLQRIQVCVLVSPQSPGSSLDIVQDVVHDLHAPVVEEIVEAVRNAYHNPNPLLSYVEIPTMVVSGVFDVYILVE